MCYNTVKHGPVRKYQLIKEEKNKMQSHQKLQRFRLDFKQPFFMLPDKIVLRTSLSKEMQFNSRKMRRTKNSSF